MHLDNYQKKIMAVLEAKGKVTLQYMTVRNVSYPNLYNYLGRKLEQFLHATALDNVYIQAVNEASCV
jgi:hypothetical protein